MRRTVLALLLATGLGVSAAASKRPASIRSREIELPQDRLVKIPSPDGRWQLIASPCSAKHCDARTLALEDRRTGRQVFIKNQYNRDLGVGWSPDSKAFFLNDAFASNVEDAYIYRPGQATPVELDDILLASDRRARSIDADHTYFQVRRWLTPHSVLAEYCGHTSNYPSVQFDFLFRVELGDGGKTAIAAHPIYGRVRPARLNGECTH
jgi:hypothetical protein